MEKYRISSKYVVQLLIDCEFSGAVGAAATMRQAEGTGLINAHSLIHLKAISMPDKPRVIRRCGPS